MDRQRILILTQVFSPELHPTGVMVADLAAALARAKHDVTVAAGFPHHPEGRLLGGYRKSLFRRERCEGFDVVRGWHLTSESKAIFARAAVMVSQAVGTALAALRTPAPNLVISYGPPLVGPLVAALIARLRGARLITVIYDIYPDIAIETGEVTNRLIIAAARIAERAVYRWSDRVVVLSDGFKRTLLAKGVDSDMIRVVPVWLDPSEIRPSTRLTSFRRAHDIGEDQLVVLYAGTIGIISGALIMLDVAERLHSIPRALLLFVGEGQVKDELVMEAKRRELNNVRFLPFQPRELLNEVQASADLSVVTLLPGRGRTSVPSKVAGYMAAGRPVIASVDLDSDTASCIRSANCGLVVEPGNADQLAEAISRLLHDPQEREQMGHAAREAFEREYAAPSVLGRFVSMLEAMAPR